MELSSIGLGTYLGDPDPTTDDGYREAARAFAQGGGTVFDTAANYRMGRSERALGEVFRELPRESFFVSTKAGYLPMADGVHPEQPRAWFQRVLAGPGVLAPEDVVDGCHALTPAYLAHQLRVSLEALQVARVDLFHLHNPEHQRPALGPEKFRTVLRKAFEACEELAAQGLIGAYGCATWNGFRVPPEAPDHLGLEQLLEDALAAGGKHHHFRWIQLPLNLAMPEAFNRATQPFGGALLTPLEAARAAGLQVQVSASLMQARILHRLPAGVLQGCRTPAQIALQFARSCPGVTTALCGMGCSGHVTENLELLAQPKAGVEELKTLVG
ncbi:MAG: aldo/keto reductase [Holophaga sp.]|nr:aldo/keto reductase [Holophaga sp.]